MNKFLTEHGVSNRTYEREGKTSLGVKPQKQHLQESHTLVFVYTKNTWNESVSEGRGSKQSYRRTRNAEVKQEKGIINSLSPFSTVPFNLYILLPLPLLLTQKEAR